jgi:protein involved in polysaccharide export with SLBB domain
MIFSHHTSERKTERRSASIWFSLCLVVSIAVLTSSMPVAAASAQGSVNIRPSDLVTDAAYTADEVKEILMFNGVEEEVAAEYLGRFDPGRTYSQSDLELMVPLLRPNDYQPSMELETALDKEIDGDKLEEIPYFPEDLLVETDEVILKPFGYELFRTGTPPGDIPEDIGVGPDYIVGIGDEILITIWGDVEKRYAKVIDRQGRMVLPDAGVITAAGKSLGQLREELNGLFSQVYQNLRMTVSLGDVRTIQVYVSGDVIVPGSYTLSALSTVLTALYVSGGPTYKGSLRNLTLTRVGSQPQEIDLYAFLLSGDRNTDLPLQSGDVLHIAPLGPTVRMVGNVRRPGIYEISGGETVRDLIQMGGGLTDLAYSKTISIDRYLDAQSNQLYKIDWNDPAQNLSLKGGDEITVYSIYQIHPRQYVEIYGEIQKPGIYRLVPGMLVSDLIFRAGGTLDSAFLDNGELARLIEMEGELPAQTSLIDLELKEIMTSPTCESDFPLIKGDKVFVRRIPGWEPPPVVIIEGEVKFPGSYGLESVTERISNIVLRAGGPTSDAFLKGAKLFSEESGRVIIDFSRALKDPTCGDNIVLADGDSLYVPRIPETIRVSGAVANPGLLLYQPGRKAGHYLDRTGGLQEKAGRVRIVRVTGEVISAKKRFWRDPKVTQGDQIIVELREDKKPIDWTKTLAESASIIASLATTVYLITNVK